MKRISLIDVDSKIPNLALMKISAYHKSKGDTVGFNLKYPDKIYQSIVFTKNRGKALNKTLIEIPVEYGGSGISLKSRLPDEIEFIKPDYDLYPSEYSMGFTSRGCNRNCYFCIVTKKEGGFKKWQHPSEFHDDRFKTMKLLDNNILLDKDRFKKLSDWFYDNNVRVDMTQGYDVRLLDDEILTYIIQIRDKSVPLKFAFDDTSLESIVRDKIQMIKDAGVNTRSHVAFYCYCHDDSMFDDTLYRSNVLRSLNVNADVMFNCDMPKTQRVKALMKWSWRKQLFWGIPFNEYSKVLHT